MADLLASSSGSNISPYDVFLNHRGPDTKSSIATHLYDCLARHRLRVFLDKPEMEKGDFFTSQIDAAIRGASVHIAIFSPGYADSVWCLDELLLMVESIELRQSTVIPVFYGVKPADLRWTPGENGGVYAKALGRLQEKKTTDSKTREEKPRYDSDRVEKWRNALSQASHIDGFEYDGYLTLPAPLPIVEGELLEDLVKLVLQKVKKPPLHVSKYPTGLDKKFQDFEELLRQQSEGPRVVGIVGLGGVGKTTLAKEIFNRLRSNYQHSSFLFDIRQKSLTTLQIDLLKDLSPTSDVQIGSEDEGKEILKSKLSSIEAVIILDNVDRAEHLEALLLPVKDVLHPSCIILVTSRDKQLLINQKIKESSIYRVDCLNPQQSRELFCWHAFHQEHPHEGFDEIVEKLLDACGGLPFSLTDLGAYLHGMKLKYWEAQSRKHSRSVTRGE